MISKALRYFIYRVYIWQLNAFGIYNRPDIVASMSVLFILYLYTFPICFLVKIAAGLRCSTDYMDKHRYFFDFIIIVITILFNRFYTQRNIKKIILEYRHETPVQIRKGTVLIVLSLVGTLILVCISIVLDRYAGENNFILIDYLNSF